ncbi:GGDEF domain-containing protein [Parvibaculum sp.]|uniref:GGDEF domain-containing protein n=1 Tax=Parvibaculum sp. TaxID=2024848 RepID=UPI00320DDAFF
MTYTDDIGVATELSMKALGLMARHGIAPLPQNYDLWFRYASGHNSDLNEAIDSALRQGLKIDDKLSADLHQRFVTHAALADATIDAGDKLNLEVNNILKLVAEAAGDSSTLATSVRKASAELSNKSTANDVRRVVDVIVAATRHMETRSKELELRLNETKSELNTLQSSLTKARNEARTDGLTGVANRKAFDEALAQAISQASIDRSPLCLVIGDIDHFKKFNDTWGHRTGDQVLRLVASCLKAGARESDTVARYGGEEFALILPGITTENAEILANGIRETVQSRELVKRSTGETLGRVTMSLGISTLRPGEGSSSLIERADACLYAAKRGGRNRVVSEMPDLAPHAKAS